MIAKKSVKKKKEYVWHCYHCGEIIKGDDKKVILSTYDGLENIEDAYWHISCWKNYFQEKVREASEKMQTAGSVMENIGRSPNILGMLGNLSKIIPKNFSFNLKNLTDGDIDPKEIQRVLKECGVDITKTKKKNDKRKTNQKK